MEASVVKFRFNGPVPEYKTSGSAGFDICANEPVFLDPGEVRAVKTGIYIEEMSPDLELQIRSRSGLALKSQIVVFNSPGTVDSDYRNEICVILKNFGHEPYFISPGDRIAQGVLSLVSRESNIQIKGTVRNGGFGSTN